MDKTIRLTCAHVHCVNDAPNIAEWITAEIERRWRIVYGDEVTVHCEATRLTEHRQALPENQGADAL